MILTLKASSKDPSDVNDLYSGKILILNYFIFLFLPKDKDHVSFILYSQTI